MAFQGFGKNSGPSIPPRTQTLFGNFPNTPSPPPQIPSTQNVPPQRSPRLGTGIGLLFDNGVFEAPQKTRSPPLALRSNPAIDILSYPSKEAWRPTLSPPRSVNDPKLLPNNLDFNSYQRSSPVAPYSAQRNAATSIPARLVPANSQGPKRTRSPPSTNAAFLEDSSHTVARRLGARADLLLENGGQVTPQRIWSPPLAYGSNHSYEDLDRPHVEDQRSHAKVANFPILKGTKSPPLSSANDVPRRDSHPPQNDSDRLVESPPRSGNKSNLLAYNSNPQTSQRSSTFAPNIVERVGTKRINSQVPKRNRSPSSPSTDEVFPGNPHSSQDDTEREMQAKAKRLARFKVELAQPEQSGYDASKLKVSGNRHDPALAEKRKFVAEHPGEATGDLMVSDYEGVDASSVIIGICPDMCPETERAERERKGDLDKYERLDGDRNQTNKSLAVKKYNRTAEREVDLIRPMPVLQKTVAYLLDLLDQPYDDRFLALYNFLWDRMRAVRMDLRMQHIFNQDAITMLEQMIRLHIIAMHELCEYTKGEGFSEGFDAHLNIEQMNKTSVELFQMYDDHRKRGISVPSEKEFRGYYALLKLDKHPGYKVEPAELSLDLAKMTPEIRQTPEILFARDVARACRTGNFIAFFRLARKATYLQACLMHAHFAKLRTQALASLHSGLQNNQGIPISQVTKWLAMEGEDIESLLEYHGFMIKEFEESYMVKEGLFLNSDKDYPTKCSQLVLLKKSSTIVEDVSSDQLVWPANEVKPVVSDRIGKLEPKAVRLVTTKTPNDEDMLKFEEESASLVRPQVHPVPEIALATDQSGSESSDHQGSEVSEASFMSWNVPSPRSPQSLPAMARRMQNRETFPNDCLVMNLRSPAKEKTLQTGTVDLPIDSYQGPYIDSLVKNSAPQRPMINAEEKVEAMIVRQEVENEEPILDSEEVDDEAAKMAHWEYEAATAKLKLILRIWKRRSSKQRELRELRSLAANAALNSLSLGPPIRHNKTQRCHVHELNIDHVLSERQERYGRSWSRLNVSEVISRILSERNPDANCLSWKLIICSQTKGVGKTNLLAGHWLLSKLMGTSKEYDDDLAVSSPCLSIWKTWVTSRLGCPPICCLSVIRDTEVNNSDDTVAGASAVLFLVTDSIPWDIQKTKLYNLLMSLPSGSRLPLLILSDMFDEELHNSSLTIVNELGLHYMDKTRISSFSIVYLLGNRPKTESLDGFFSNDHLIEGLQWLASESPLQPALRCMKTRELVMGHFNCSLEMLDKINISLVDPNHCITAFNAALDRTVEEVVTAANTNHISWPCPEIDLLESSSDEHRAVASFLPSVGWSSAESIKPIISTMQDSKLPFFADDLSWLNHGSAMGKEIQNQKAELEKCLIRYLAHTSQMMEWELATMEAGVMLQNGAQLELHDVNFKIIPRWVAIFRRISNWRLMNLTTGVSSVACVLGNQRESSAEPSDTTSPTSECLDNLSLDGDRYPSYALTQPSLDEMIEVGCSPLPFGRNELEPESTEPHLETLDERNEPLEATRTSVLMEDDGNLRQDGEYTRTVASDNYVSSIFVVGSKVKKEADRLSKLLEQCNMLQDRIDEKLSIYF